MHVEDANRVLAASLAIFAVVAAIAGTVAIGQAFARHIERGADNQRLLRALGVTRVQRFVTLLAPAAVSALAGVALAMVAAACASSLFPTGFARRIEPDPGLALDWVVLGAGLPCWRSSWLRRPRWPRGAPRAGARRLAAPACRRVSWPRSHAPICRRRL